MYEKIRIRKDAKWRQATIVMKRFKDVAFLFLFFSLFTIIILSSSPLSLSLSLSFSFFFFFWFPSNYEPLIMSAVHAKSKEMKIRWNCTRDLKSVEQNEFLTETQHSI